MNWHWALDQYVSPKNSIKSCQKYMKVEEYWYGTIKNYIYDGDVSQIYYPLDFSLSLNSSIPVACHVISRLLASSG